MELVSPLTSAGHKTRRFQHLQVLRDGLPGQSRLASQSKPGADLEERLTVPLDEFVENGPPGRRRECVKDITHVQTIGKWRLAYQPTNGELVLGG